MSKPIEIACFTDVLCVWAYVSQVRIDELHSEWQQDVRIQHHFINVFGCTAQRIGEGWADRGGYEGFGRHVQEVGEQFPHVDLSPDIWTRCRPQSSGNAHLLLKAVQLLQQESSPARSGDPALFEAMAWGVRLAFFRDARDIGDMAVLLALAEEQGLASARIEELIRSGAAMAALARDSELRDKYQLAGSPSYVLNEGRQKLYGNVGYRILDANVRELREHYPSEASWC